MNAEFPRYGVAGQQVYNLVFKLEQTERAFRRDLVDFNVQLTNLVAGNTTQTFVASVWNSPIAEDHSRNPFRNGGCSPGFFCIT